MFRKLTDIPINLGNTEGIGVNYDADILVKALEDGKDITKERIYHVHKITHYGDCPFDIWLTNDKGKEARFRMYFFEDYN